MTVPEFLFCVSLHADAAVEMVDGFCYEEAIVFVVLCSTVNAYNNNKAKQQAD